MSRNLKHNATTSILKRPLTIVAAGIVSCANLAAQELNVTLPTSAMNDRTNLAPALATGPGLASANPRFAVKMNLLYAGATLTPNLQFEVGLNDRSTLDFAGAYNPWNRKGSEDNNKKTVHSLALVEYRYWTRERFSGHFFGGHILGSHYNVGGRKIPGMFSKEYRNEGYGLGAGVSYGYHFNFNDKLGLQLTAGLGAIWLEYDKYGCNKCNEVIGKHDKVYFGPTRIGINLVYMIK